MDTSSHCRLVDDSSLLTATNLKTPETPDSCHKLHAPGSSDTTSPKVAEVHGSSGMGPTGVETSASLQPLLGSRPHTGQQAP